MTEKHIQFKKAIKNFNKYRSPEVITKLIKVDIHCIIVEFSFFCKTCGIYDYFDDLSIEIEKLTNKKVKVNEAKEIENSFSGSKFLVSYFI